MDISLLNLGTHYHSLGINAGPSKPKTSSWTTKKPAIFGGEWEDDVFWHPKSRNPLPDNFTPGYYSFAPLILPHNVVGLIPFIRKALQASLSQKKTARAILGYKGLVHIKKEYKDTGWGCGSV